MSRYVINNGRTIAYGHDERGWFVQARDEFGTVLLDRCTARDGLTGPDLDEELRWLGVSREVPMVHRLRMANDNERRF